MVILLAWGIRNPRKILVGTPHGKRPRVRCRSW